ncbi:LamG-like jellyroll fold domain-containing protein [Parasediminibacterium sp. JCM 36343]|uniref:LamG-like jellyroll fold domain-containing protein n=1 Tax=Parasediminibacterium sp. JCM 36343 TaxID=3374279 RepID=UPI00397C8598
MEQCTSMKKMAVVLFSIVGMLCLINASAQYNKADAQPIITETGLFNRASFFTFEFWVKTTENSGSNTYWQRPALFGNITDGYNSGDFSINTNYGYIGMWEGFSSNNSDQIFLSDRVRINDNQWHHIAAVNDGINVNLFVDGQKIGSLVSGRQLITDKIPLAFGAVSMGFAWAGNAYNNTNFPSAAVFGSARLSNSVKYGANFIPQQHLPADASTIKIYQFDDPNWQANSNTQYGGQGNNNQYPISARRAEKATLYFNDNTKHDGWLSIEKQPYNPNNDVCIRFAEGDSPKFDYYKPEDVKNFQIGDDFFETKFINVPGIAIGTNKKAIVKLLTSPDSRIKMYLYESKTLEPNTTTGKKELKTQLLYLLSLPSGKEDVLYGFQDNIFCPHFDEKVSLMVQDKPDLAAKIKKKDKSVFYAAFSTDDHRLKVWWNIINEYNKP